MGKFCLWEYFCKAQYIKWTDQLTILIDLVPYDLFYSQYTGGNNHESFETVLYIPEIYADTVRLGRMKENRIFLWTYCLGFMHPSFFFVPRDLKLSIRPIRGPSYKTMVLPYKYKSASNACWWEHSRCANILHVFVNYKNET